MKRKPFAIGILLIQVSFLFIILLPFAAVAQVNISGRILNYNDNKPIANANVFLNNASVGGKTNDDGSFKLSNAKPGKYDLVVSIIGFETYRQTLIVSSSNITLPDIAISPKTIILKEVSIKSAFDPNWQRNYELFRNEFLGSSELAKDCKIINPELLDFSYNDTTRTLTASSADFLIVENKALGYRVKYLLTRFIKNTNAGTLHFEGPTLFEALKGTAGEEKKWQRKRQEVYEGSQMHFLRSALANRVEEEGFRVFQYAIYRNPQKPLNSLIADKIKFFKNKKKSNSNFRDSLSFWVKTSRLPDTIKELRHFPLKLAEIINRTDQNGIYALGCEKDALYIIYNKGHHFFSKEKFDYLIDPYKKDVTLLYFNTSYAFFDNNGWVTDPASFSVNGEWSKSRVAGLLPQDYEPIESRTINIDSTRAFKNILAGFKTFSTNHITEKAYLHFDKPYYAAGDTIYFKAYVTLGEKHELSKLSEVLHVDLINTDNKIDQRLKLQISDGVAWGDFALPDSLPFGNYRVRAYTNWMRNEGNDAYFDKTLAIGSISSNKIPESGLPVQKTISTKPDTRFLPEAGNMVTGIHTKVAFKAIGTNGLGINVKGIITDNENKEITAFSSIHAGMGYFYITPQEGKTYKAKITYTGGSTDIIDLPKAEEKGITLSVNNDSIPKASVRIEANKLYFNENKTKVYSILVLSGGVVTTVPCTLDSNVITLDILKRRLHTGITTITLFSPAGEPLCERLFFVQNYDQLSLNVSSDKATYAKREKVNIQLKALNRSGFAATGHFSISVIDESKVPVEENNENTILTNLLLTSDLKGYVEQPNYYFNNITDKTNSDLDLVMLIHGYRWFEWKKLLNNEYPPVTYQPENGLQISGIAKNGFGKPLVNGTVSLIAPKGGPVLSQRTDEKGNFSFNNLAFTDSTKFILQAVNAKGKNATTLVYNKETAAPVVTVASREQESALSQPKAAYLQNSLKQHDEAVQYGKANGILLKEVKIRQSKKHIIDEGYRSSSLLGPGHADQVMHRKEIEQIGGQFATSLNGRLRGVLFSNPQGGNGGVPFLREGNGPMLIVVDGAHLPLGSGVNQLNPNNIETIEVLRFASASIYGIEGGNGVLVITTRQGGQDPEEIEAVGILPIAVNGFYKAREFYAPKYEHEANSFNLKDLRSTIYWQPELVTDKDGNASFSYYNADGAGIYKVVIEGIDENGNLGRKVYCYKVN